jgi:hypothetical protein
MRNAYRILVGKSYWKGTLGRKLDRRVIFMRILKAYGGGCDLD